MNQLEKDRLIEKFMGWELKWSNEEGFRGWSFYNNISNEYLGGVRYCDSVIGFTTDWNWLMKALKKFDRLYENDKIVSSLLPVGYVDYKKYCDQIDYAVTLYSIDDAVNALCEGIEWYNSTLN